MEERLRRFYAWCDNPRRALALVAVFLASQAAMAAMFARLPGQEGVELQLTLDPARFQSIITGWGPAGITVYLQHYWLDMIHPLWYSLALAGAWASTFSRLGFPSLTAPRWALAGVVVPLVAGALDICENCAHIIELHWLWPGHFSAAVMYAGNLAAWTKWTLALGELVVVLVALVVLAMRKRRRG